MRDKSKVEELLSDSDFDEGTLDSLTANASRYQSDSDEEENLPLQELVKKRKEKRSNTATDNEK